MARNLKPVPSPESAPDCPEFFGAMVAKEISQGLRVYKFVAPFIGLHVVMLVAFAYDVSHSSDPGFGSVGGSFVLPIEAGGIGAAEGFWFCALLILGAVLPIAAISTLEEEMQEGNWELLKVAGLTRWQIIGGKWLSHCLIGILVAMAMMPYLLVRYFLGGMDVGFTLLALLAAISLNATANAFAIGASGFSHLITRLFVGAILVGTYYLSAMMVGFSTALLAGLLNKTNYSLNTTAFVFGLSMASLLFIGIGLQMGRAHIRRVIRPLPIDTIENNTPAGIAWLAIAMPIIMVMGGVLTAGMGGIFIAWLFAWIIFSMDRRRPRRPVRPPVEPEDF